MTRPAFIHSGGDCFWTGDMRQPLNEADLDYLQATYRDECFAALAAGDGEAFTAAKTLLSELILARTARKGWARCMGAA